MSQIFSILLEVSLGYQYIEIGVVLRETILLSKMLLSAESWHKLFQYQIERLEDVDLAFFRQLFNSHSKTGIEFYFSESGTIPIPIKISVRRLMYWWHIVRVNKSELISRVYSAQKLSAVSGDWVKLLETDKEEFKINLTDEEVCRLSALKFKNYLKKKSVELTIQYLQRLKRKHSKSEHLDVTDLAMSEYLIDDRFTKSERELLFKLRSRTVLVKDNFKNAYLNNDMLCELCNLFTCTQSHPLQCPRINSRIIVDKQLNISDKFIYGTVDEQLLYVRIYKQFWDIREEMISQQKSQ